MFRKLSIAALLVLAAGAQAQKKVASVPFCATPTLEAFGCAIDGTAAGVLTCAGLVAPFDGVDDPTIVAPVIRPASLLTPTGDHVSPLRAGACAAAGAARIGIWDASCVRDVYEPILVRLPDVAVLAAAAFPTAAQLQAACQAVAVTPATANTNNAICSAQLSVTENAAARGMSKLGSSAWYNYAPVPAYALIGGYQNQPFGPAVAAAPVSAQQYCVFWPSYTAVVGRSGGGTNKWAKPVINTITTTSAATNVPAGIAGFFDLLGTPAGALARNNALFNPIYQETITVNYFKSYLNWNQL